MPIAALTTFSGVRVEPLYDPKSARAQHVNIAASQTIARGTILGEVTATPGTFKAYASGNVDGTQVARGIAMYDMITDASGNITFTVTAAQVGSDIGVAHKSAPIWMSGFFATGDLVGLDANAVTTMGGNLREGTVTAGVLKF